MSNTRQYPTPSELKAFIEANPKLVHVKQSTEYPELRVVKYARKVFYDSLWSQNPILEDMRGLVIDADYNCIVRPFRKIFNKGECGTADNLKPDQSVYVARKVNGFMAAVTKYNDQILISTTGSLDSDFCGYAREYLGNIDPDQLCDDYTYMFEVCHPLDPHIIPEDHGAYFLASVCHIDPDIVGYEFDGMDTDISVYFDTIGIVTKYTKEFPLMKYSELLELVKTCKHEGYVVLCYPDKDYSSPLTFKIKSPFYLASKAIARKADIFKLNMQFVDEEYFELITYLKTIPDFNETPEQVRLELIRNYFMKEVK